MEPWSAAAVAAPCSLASVYSLVGVQATSMLFTLFEGNVSFEIFGTFTVISKSNKKGSIYQTKISLLYYTFDLTCWDYLNALIGFLIISSVVSHFSGQNSAHVLN